ncbi:hypothetical protein DB44_DJ00320 [Candidatus Protochlamydia amoebophila]|uniref:Transposase DDE domain-containing protein n=1 Tax=Candidatus Protochlamydia amoebophila TaxID=362787 RepID=A0A0C1JWC5_9BACT|nr:hypothetical protein DB44_DJ00320 [Candidatus Protochlamydia amoebophila]
MAFQLNFENVSDVAFAETLSKGIFRKIFVDKEVMSKELSKRLLKQGPEND